MKIELEKPFKDDYKAGYLNINKEPRRLILLVRHDNSQTSISYARYLYSVSIGRYLTKDEHVDHIDGDRLNDTLENFQLLSQKDNNIKSVIQNNKTAKEIDFICPVCGKSFKRPKHNFSYRPNYVPACSRRCGGIKSHLT